MSTQTTIVESDRDLQGLRFAIVAARFNAHVVDRLLAGALDALTGAASLQVIRVPGAFEIPLAAKRVAEQGGCDALVALGAVIRGETPHFDFVARACARGLMRVMLDTGVPVGFGVLTCDTLAQAEARSGGAAGNKGRDAAMAAVEMTGLLRKVAG